MYDLVTFGEAMLRLSPPNFRRLEQTTNFDVQIGGAEMNVAVAASRLGLKTAFVTKLPRNPLGKMVENKNREQGVDTQHILWTDEGRVGIYYLEFGASPRASRVVYDRSGSAISTVRPGEIDWKRILGQTRLFHLSGITPALSPTAAETTLEALKTAREVNCLVSVDLNYRAKLWSQQQANKTMTKVMEYTDLLFTTEEDTQRVFGITADTYEEVAATLAERFSLETVAITLRGNISVWKNTWTAIAYKAGKIYRDKTYELEIVDRVGGGDSFTAGFLYGYLKFNKDVQKAVQYGDAFSALKHSIPGDFNWSTLEEVEAQLKGAGLRVVR
ncbi:MAG: sugar kinase [Candidatus Latescibacterota bacterium]|nr:MAG: sugar kinase [Candidatus Latescibacterota bacterium]RKY72525.1 MAG: sugar kinase [Candidatus Latescibacterota bacterium]